ncbi:hypothetical protein [Streptomyces subrutilus]|uniref:hypothetical protein n=1 Tax=Streptomyces subrutilus TaxID=36818 RepID=UPI0033E8D426
MGFDEEWNRLRTEAAGCSVAREATTTPGKPDAVEPREAARRRLAEFRSRVVLLPLDERGGAWTAAFGGLDWLCAFSGKEAWRSAVRDVNSSDILPGNQLIDATGLWHEVDDAVDRIVGPAPGAQPGRER